MPFFERKINFAECQLSFIRHLRAIADGDLEAEEAVRSYHADLQREGLSPHRPLEADLALTQVGCAPRA